MSALTAGCPLLLLLDAGCCHGLQSPTVSAPRLLELRLDYCTALSDGAVSDALVLCSSLTKLSLQSCVALRDPALRCHHTHAHMHACMRVHMHMHAHTAGAHTCMHACICAWMFSSASLIEVRLEGCANLSDAAVGTLLERGRHGGLMVSNRRMDWW